MEMLKHAQVKLKTSQLFVLVIIHHSLHQAYSDTSTSCSSGVEYDCKFLQGNGSGCVSYCNSTVTERLSPGYCEDDCCRFCHSGCQECFYIKILSFCVSGSSTSLTDYVFEQTFKQLNSLDHNVTTALMELLYSSNITFVKIAFLQEKWSSKRRCTIQVYVRITSRKKSTEMLSINMIRNATKTGQLGGLTVLPSVFEVMIEKDYALLKNNTSKGDDLDVVELIATCVGVVIILTAVGWCLFYLCTTEHQREKCTRCNRNRTDA